MNLKKYIREIPNFPKPGILFRDITPLLSAPEALRAAIDIMSARAKLKNAEAIVAIESRGFIFGAPIALQLGLPFVPIRKPGKLPAKTHSVEYSLEYGSGRLDIHEDALRPGTKVVIVDDVLATGGTAAGAAELVRVCGGQIVLFEFLIELLPLQGRKRLGSSAIEALMEY